jgi:type III HopA1-like effector protein
VSGRYAEQVLAALGAIGLRPPAAYLWFGRRFAVMPGDSLSGAIQQRLLADFQPTGVPQPARRDQAAPAGDGGAFARALSQANCGRGSWQPGWRVAGVEEEAIAVVRPDGLALLAPPQDCRIDGALAAVRIPKDLAGLVPGALHVLGDAAAPDGAERVRLYCDVTAAAAVTFVARVTYALNRAALPFTLDVRADPARYGPGPAAELLVARADAAAAIAVLRPLLRTLGPPRRSGDAPAFARPLAPGLALAEEPGTGEPFGEHRCRLLAEAIVAAVADRRDGLAAVIERFAADGISFDAPYLQPGSIDAYDRP